MAFCCCSNATGAKVIAIISIIGSFMTVLIFGGMVAFGAVSTQERLNQTDEGIYLLTGMFASVFPEAGSAGYEFLNRQQGENKSDKITIDGELYYQPDFVKFLKTSLGHFSLYFSIVYFSLGITYLIVSIELLQGVRTRNYWRCNIWFKWYTAALVAGILCQLLLVIFVDENYISKLINGVIGWAIGFYFIFVVYGFMKDLEKEMDQGGKQGKY